MAATSADVCSMDWRVCRPRLESEIWRWFQERATTSEHVLASPILDVMEDTIIRSDLCWLRDMPSRFMAARVGQFLTGHFPTAKYLHRFHHVPSPFCDCCGVVDTRAHLLLDCHRWTFLRQQLSQWLSEEGHPYKGVGAPVAAWTWEFLVGCRAGRLWLGRFLVAIRPRWHIPDQIRSEALVTPSEED